MLNFKSFLILFIFTVFSCKNVPEAYKNIDENVETSSIYHSSTEVLISAHRGGSGINNYPENTLETMKYLHKKGVQVFEIDIIQSEDGKLMLFHDNHLERTTNGNGSIKGKTANELRNYNLIDDFGNITTYKIPYLKDIFVWAKNNDAHLMLDFKKSASYRKVIDLIHQENVEDLVTLIAYSTAQAKKLHKLAPEMLISASARNEKELDWILETSIPTDKIIAFTGTKLSNENLYKKLKNLKIPAILGTLGNLDRMAKSKGDKLYQKWADMGIKVISTDRPIEAYNAVKQ